VTFERSFRAISYASVACGFLALWISGTFGAVVTAVFFTALITSWVIEDTSYQISEKVGTTLIVLALPAFYLMWKYHVIELYGAETAVAGILARMILALTCIKLLQQKGDRDWIFLYLMSFFEILLAAGLSISGLYVLTFLVYVLLMVSAIIAFEMRKTARAVAASTGRKGDGIPLLQVRRLPSTAVLILIVVIGIAVPLFFMLPRVGGAGFGGSQRGLSTSTGFSDVVRLGGIGNIQQNDEVVMRVELEGKPVQSGLYFRGVALDTFDNHSWSRSRSAGREPYAKGDRDIIQLGEAAARDKLIVQTIFLEPIDTPVLFAIPKAIAIQGSFPIVEKDAYGSISYRRTYERVSYTVLSDQSLPDPAVLRNDNAVYGTDSQNYLQLPEKYDRRIFELAYSIASKERNRYDRAAAVERYLQNNFGYTLDQKAGGDEPVADFLFNVREGHCEYFATAMAIMLRTQGIATRIVNGFHGGDYNDTSEMTVVRQRNAHSWVEVYFPKEDVWVPFDPTPFSNEIGGSGTGITARVSKYLEAMEAFWIQHFVAYDNQGQRSLVRSVRNGFIDYQADIAEYFQHSKALLDEWWSDVRGDNGSAASLIAAGRGTAYIGGAAFILLLLAFLWRKVVKLKVWRHLHARVSAVPKRSVVEFYERLLEVLAGKGMVRPPHQTPLEFAYGVGLPGAIAITEKYQGVRFGQQKVTEDEAQELDDLIDQIANV
jgi:transglutaminase-like putative cysteine protease